jgi:hypothetical protein
MLRNAGLALSLVFFLACVGQQPPGMGDDDGVGGDDDGVGGDVDAAPPMPPDYSVNVPVDADRPVDIMPPSRLGMIAPRMPHVADPWLRDVLESPDTMWYDRLSIIPGYQDSFGDNTQLPIGMRPNSIDAVMINLAVPGGHQQLFLENGLFHFPFGRGIGTAARTDNFVVDFWQLPRSDAGAIVPVVYYQRDPNTYTHRVEWMFPKGTIFGEVIFQIDSTGTWYPFEIRVRIRELDHWRNDVYRPFPTGPDLASALEAAAAANPSWQTADVAALAAHARNSATVVAETLGATHYASAFPSTPGAKDVLPGLANPAIIKELLMKTPFRSAKGLPWKQQGSLVAHAATTQASFHIVPRDYDGGHLEVSDDSCKRCHQDAGRPFRDWYPNVIAYGELWGGDDVFTWHPFDAANFVDASGDVRNFNYDNRRIRADFTAGGVIVRYVPAQHPATTWGQLPGAWKNYAY